MSSASASKSENGTDVKWLLDNPNFTGWNAISEESWSRTFAGLLSEAKRGGVARALEVCFTVHGVNEKLPSENQIMELCNHDIFTAANLSDGEKKSLIERCARNFGDIFDSIKGPSGDSDGNEWDSIDVRGLLDNPHSIDWKSMSVDKWNLVVAYLMYSAQHGDIADVMKVFFTVDDSANHLLTHEQIKDIYNHTFFEEAMNHGNRRGEKLEVGQIRGLCDEYILRFSDVTKGR